MLRECLTPLRIEKRPRRSCCSGDVVIVLTASDPGPAVYLIVRLLRYRKTAFRPSVRIGYEKMRPTVLVPFGTPEEGFGFGRGSRPKFPLSNRRNMEHNSKNCSRAPCPCTSFSGDVTSLNSHRYSGLAVLFYGSDWSWQAVASGLFVLVTTFC